MLPTRAKNYMLGLRLGFQDVMPMVIIDCNPIPLSLMEHDHWIEQELYI